MSVLSHQSSVPVVSYQLSQQGVAHSCFLIQSVLLRTCVNHLCCQHSSTKPAACSHHWLNSSMESANCNQRFLSLSAIDRHCCMPTILTSTHWLSASTAATSKDHHCRHHSETTYCMNWSRSQPPLGIAGQPHHMPLTDSSFCHSPPVLATDFHWHQLMGHIACLQWTQPSFDRLIDASQLPPPTETHKSRASGSTKWMVRNHWYLMTDLN